MEEEFLFVYGTLMKDYPQNPFKSAFQTSTEYVGKAYTFGKLYLVDYYPGIVANKLGENFKTFGEIYKIKKPESLLLTLDEYEDYFPNDQDKSLYIRRKTNCILLETENSIHCWAYFYNQAVDKLKYFKNGDFFDKVN